MKEYNYDVSDFINALQNLLTVRGGLSTRDASRVIVDVIEDINIAIQDDVPVQVFFNELMEEDV